MIDFDDCNSGAIHTPPDYDISTTITTHHFYIITVKVMLINPLKINRMILLLHI